jgi:hypothetical protein
MNHRTLRAKGLTIRKTVDCLIATRCIEVGLIAFPQRSCSELGQRTTKVHSPSCLLHRPSKSRHARSSELG